MRRNRWTFSILIALVLCAAVLSFRFYIFDSSREIANSAVTLASVETLTKSFDEIIFAPSDMTNIVYHYVNRWKDQIQISIKGNEKEKWRSEVERTVRQLELVTGLRIDVLTYSKNEGNALIIFVRKKNMRETEISYHGAEFVRKYYNNKIICSFRIRTIGNHFDLSNAIVIIPIDISKNTVVRCITEELTQMLGLYNDKAQYPWSIFSDGPGPKTLTMNDKILVRTLYDPRIKLGMTRARAMRTARLVIAELVAAVQEKGEKGLIHPYYVDR